MVLPSYLVHVHLMSILVLILFNYTIILMKKLIAFSIFCFALISCGEKQKKEVVELPPAKLKALIIDGQNNHYVWPKTTMMMKGYLEETNLFTVDIHRMDSVWLGIKYNQSRPETYTSFIETYPLTDKMYNISDSPIKTSEFAFDFKDYDVIISNLGAESPLWPEKTRSDFESYMANGGGFVVIHAANNAWGEWEEFNKMISINHKSTRTSNNERFT